MRRHRRPQRRPLGSHEGDRRRPYRAASSTNRVFFIASDLSGPMQGVTPLRGDNPLCRTVARARGPGEESAASPRPAPAGADGAGEQQQRGEAVGEPGFAADLEALRPARAAFLRRFGELFGRDPAFSHSRWGERLDRALARLDRYADFGRGREGAGLEFALALLEADAEEVRWDRRREEPRSAAYYVPLLEQVSKEWRRKQAPRSATAPAGWRGSWAHPKERPARGGNPRAGRRTTH